jgi:serine/threonine-protein kinase
MAEDPKGREQAPPSEGDVKASAGAKPGDAPSNTTADSFLRAAAEISVPSPSEAAGYAAGAAGAEFVAGEVVAKRYRLDRELGRGGMGVVWEATHLVTRRRIAIKFVMGPAHQRADLRRRFLREARAASAANHPNVVDVLDVFELDDGTPVMVMELLSGETLRDKLVRERTLSLEATASILLPVIAAVGTAHALGIVHRDLKPENIFLLKGAEPGVDVKVLDFGVAKLTVRDGEASETDPITGTGSTLGTPCYMAPEQTTGDKAIDGRADVWALGVIVYECLAGVRPVEGSGIGQVVMKLMTEGIKPLDQVVRGLPPEATALVMRMLARERRDRPQDLREVQGVLARFTHVKPRPFDAPGALPSGEGPQSTSRPPQLRTPAVDTQSPQSIPNGVRHTSRRSLLAGTVAGAIVLATFVAWRVTARAPPPSAARGLAESATGVAVPLATLALPAPVDAAMASLPATGVAADASPASASELAASHAVRVDLPAKGPSKAAAGGSPSRVDGAAVAPSPAVSEPVPAPPKPAPGGLPEKPPF